MFLFVFLLLFCIIESRHFDKKLFPSSGMCKSEQFFQLLYYISTLCTNMAATQNLFRNMIYTHTHPCLNSSSSSPSRLFHIFFLFSTTFTYLCNIFHLSNLFISHLLLEKKNSIFVADNCCLPSQYTFSFLTHMILN